MAGLSPLLTALGRTWAEWRELRWTGVRFVEPRTAMLVLGCLLAIALMTLLVRRRRARRHGNENESVLLPAILPIMRPSRLSVTRHFAFALVLAGLPFFAAALADPYGASTTREGANPGRRIAIMIDASRSVNDRFRSASLNRSDETTFLATMAAAEYFVKRRLNGSYRDRMALLELGQQADVVTPFTTDYRSLLLSIRFLGDDDERQVADRKAADFQPIGEGAEMFKEVDLPETSGNVLVVFSDGRNGGVMPNGSPLDGVLADAREAAMPVYMLRMAFHEPFGPAAPSDEIWKRVVEGTGGRFHRAPDEAAILGAVREFDRLIAGQIHVPEQAARRPAFAGYALVAVLLWLTAVSLKLTVGRFRTFP